MAFPGASAGYLTTRSTTNFNVPLPCVCTITRSCGFIVCNDQKIAGSPPTRSTCPAITALPLCPGAAPGAYQKTLLQYGELTACEVGASICPFAVVPTLRTDVSICRLGMRKWSGCQGVGFTGNEVA